MLKLIFFFYLLELVISFFDVLAVNSLVLARSFMLRVFLIMLIAVIPSPMAEMAYFV